MFYISKCVFCYLAREFYQMKKVTWCPTAKPGCPTALLWVTLNRNSHEGISFGNSPPHIAGDLETIAEASEE
jgi:hypothetical protein